MLVTAITVVDVNVLASIPSDENIKVSNTKTVKETIPVQTAKNSERTTSSSQKNDASEAEKESASNVLTAVVEDLPPSAPKVSPQFSDATVNAVIIPASMKLIYDVTGISQGLNYTAKSELAWRHNGDAYDAIMTIQGSPSGMRTMASGGQIAAEGLIPKRFIERARSNQSISFEASAGKIIVNAKSSDMVLKKGTQDYLSVLFQLSSMLAGDPQKRFPGATITLYTVNPQQVETWIFTVETEDKASTSFEDRDTLRLTHRPNSDSSQKVEIWYTPSLGYLPVRSRITQENGDYVEQRLNTYGKQ